MQLKALKEALLYHKKRSVRFYACAIGKAFMLESKGIKYCALLCQIWVEESFNSTSTSAAASITTTTTTTSNMYIYLFTYLFIHVYLFICLFIYLYNIFIYLYLFIRL